MTSVITRSSTLAEVGVTRFDMPASPPRVWEAISKARK
jgi:hypothetical protein